MLFSAYNTQAVFLCLLLAAIGGITALARADNNWPYKRSKNIAIRSAGYQPAAVGVGYQQPFQRNQTQWQGSSQNNRTTQYNQPGYRPAINKPQQPTYAQVASNHTRPSWQQSPQSNHVQYPAYGHQGNFNQSRTAWQQPQVPNHYASANHTRPGIVNYPYHSPGSLNQTRPQQISPIYPQISSHGQQRPLNQTHPVWLQPSAPQLPNYPAQPTSNHKPALPSNSWTYTANQTNLYPKLPAFNAPATGNSASHLAPLKPQGPHNWRSGGQAVLSYPVPGQNRNASTHQGNSNPYANIFN